MPRRDATVSLRHMLDHAKKAVNLARAKIRAGLDTERLLNLALIRLLKIIAEAESRVPKTIVLSIRRIRDRRSLVYEIVSLTANQTRKR